MKRIITLIGVCLFILILASCGKPEAKKFKKIENKEKKDVYETFAEVKADAEKWNEMGADEEVVSDIRDKQIPKCREVLEKIKKIEADTPELELLNQKYIKVIELHIEGYGLIARGTEEMEDEDIEKGMDLVHEGERLLEEYNSDVSKLAKKYKVKLKNK